MARDRGLRGAVAPGGLFAMFCALSSAALAQDAPPWWSGFYAGGHVGAAWGRSRIHATPFEPTVDGVQSLAVRDAQFGPGVGGLQAGWNSQVGGSWMFGLEIDATFPNLMDTHRDVFVPSGIYTRQEEMQSYGSLRARIGYAFGDWLIYGTAGVAGARSYVFRTQQTGTAFGGLAQADDAETARVWRAGWTIGGGVEFHLADAWSARLEYRHTQFGARGAYFPLAGQRVTSDLALNEVRLGLNYHFGQPGRDAPAGAGVLPNLDMFSIHGQTTQVVQSALPFRALYSGVNSLYPGFQTRETISVTGFLGFRPWAGTEFYFNPEPFQGFGLSQTHGAAGFPNGEAQKGGSSWPHYSTARLFMRQVFGFGGEQEEIEAGANQFAGKVDISRLTFTAGKMAVPDIFDGNQYAHDQRVHFLNWSFFDAGAFDYAADQKGYTWGAALELNQKYWAARAGYFLLPDQPNGANFDTRLGRRGQYIGELELRHDQFDLPGKLRLIAWFSRGYSGSFGEVNYNPLYGGDITLTRRGRPGNGFVVNVEQALTADLGFFARLSWRNGHNEIMSFTDIDRAFSAGLVQKGTPWGRPKDKVGMAFAVNALNSGYRIFLTNGGLGINIGDGYLTYRRESVFETYYALNLNEWSTLTFDYQHIANPGYNADRGPASVFALRLHTEF